MKFEYPDSVRFRCIKCGLCCGDTDENVRHILLLTSEAEQISKSALKPTSQFAAKISGREPFKFEMKKRTEDGKCIFLENTLCTIYSVRPLICRFYPFELSSESGKHRFLFTEECPGINRGRVLSEVYFRKMFRLALNRHKEK